MREGGGEKNPPQFSFWFGVVFIMPFEQTFSKLCIAYICCKLSYQ